MNNDIYIEIIKHSHIRDFPALMRVNKFFNYYTKKFLMKKVVKKHLKNVKCNLLYKRNDMLHMFNLLYNPMFDFSIDEFINTNINDFKVPSQLIKSRDGSDSNLFCSLGKIFSTRVEHHGDICQSFTIKGKNIKKIEMYIGGILVWKSWYLDAGLINVQPFFNGIFLIKLAFHEVIIRVYAEECDIIYCYYKFLQDDLRRHLAQNHFTLPYVFYNKNTLYKSITYQNGMITLN